MAVKLWSSEEDTILLELLKQGKTAAQIGSVLGRPRNSVIGRSHRLRDKKGEGTNASFRDNSRPKIPRVRKPRPFALETFLVFDEKQTLATSILNLRSDQCRWPLSNTFCEDVRAEGRSYCPAHCRLAYRPIPEGARR